VSKPDDFLDTPNNTQYAQGSLHPQQLAGGKRADRMCQSARALRLGPGAFAPGFSHPARFRGVGSGQVQEVLLWQLIRIPFLLLCLNTAPSSDVTSKGPPSPLLVSPVPGYWRLNRTPAYRAYMERGGRAAKRSGAAALPPRGAEVSAKPRPSTLSAAAPHYCTGAIMLKQLE
jgi:hypothetical protein